MRLFLPPPYPYVLLLPRALFQHIRVYKLEFGKFPSVFIPPEGIVTYDGAAAYQAQVIASNRIANL